VLLSFAQFEREVTGERIRDKIAASKKKGMWQKSLVSNGTARIDVRKPRHISQTILAVSHIMPNGRGRLLAAVRS
jgi:DNA invertase Pin-like site-specific DNA recombinase